jgi:hypothetical protein
MRMKFPILGLVIISGSSLPLVVPAVAKSIWNFFRFFSIYSPISVVFGIATVVIFGLAMWQLRQTQLRGIYPLRVATAVFIAHAVLVYAWWSLCSRIAARESILAWAYHLYLHLSLEMPTWGAVWLVHLIAIWTGFSLGWQDEPYPAFYVTYAIVGGLFYAFLPGLFWRWIMPTAKRA